MFLFGFLVNFGENRKMSKEEKLGKNRGLRLSEGPSLQQGQGPKWPPHEFAAAYPLYAAAKQCFTAAKALFTRAKIFILFRKSHIRAPIV